FKERIFGIGLTICDLNCPTSKHGAADNGATTHFDWMILHEPLDFRRMTEIRDLPIHATLLAIDRSHVRIAQSDRRLDERIKHSLKIERRSADDLEHVSGGGLLLQRLSQFVEQPRVLDGDDGLRGEIGDQLDLLVGKGAYLLAVDGDDANQFVLFEHWDGQESPRAKNLDSRDT